MMFNEIYSKYFLTVRKILEKSCEEAVTDKDIYSFVEENAFSESALTIPDKLNDSWYLLKDGKSVLNNPPVYPQSDIEKRWLKTITQDDRIKLFMDEIPELKDVEPLYPKDFFVYYDRYSDGDPYTDERYIQNFKTILKAIKEKRWIKIVFNGHKSGAQDWRCVPVQLEYSQKDDKFRLLAYKGKIRLVINLGRVTEVTILDKQEDEVRSPEQVMKTVVVEITDERNTLERFMIDFSHFEKRANKIADDKYSVAISYNQDDETELLIRILAYGPTVKVVAPQTFVDLVKNRIIKQRKVARN